MAGKWIAIQNHYYSSQQLNTTIAKLAIFFGTGKVDHVVGQYFRNPSNLCTDHQESATGSFNNGNAKSLGQTGIQEDVTSDQ